MKCIVHLATCLAFVAGSAQTARAQELTKATYERWRDKIDVTPDELCWQKINWLSFWDGLVAAQQRDQPIFYWIYFGDPRGGC